MADLTVLINEKITLDGNDRGVLTTQTITGINNIDNRIITAPTGSYTPLFSFESDSFYNPGTFLTGSFQYGRITNKSNTLIELRVIFNDSPYTASFAITPGNSFMLSSTKFAAGSMSNPSDNFVFPQTISSITIQPSGSSAKIEYFIATT